MGDQQEGGGGGFGFHRKLAFKFQTKVGNVERTEMTPQFQADMKAYDDYNPATAKLISLLEHIYQPDESLIEPGKIETLPGQHPLEKVKKALDAFEKVIPSEKASSIRKVGKMVESAAEKVRPFQTKHRQQIPHLRRFTVMEYKNMETAREQFNNARDVMDAAKHEVKQSKTTEQIEKRAIIYQQHVELFDGQCDKMMKVLSDLPNIKADHGKEVLHFIAVHKEYHNAMANAFK